MEFFFLTPGVSNEIILFCVVACIFFATLLWYGYRPISRIVRKFGAKGRDARIDGRDKELLKEREKTEEMSFGEQVQNLDNPILSGDDTIPETKTKQEETKEETEEKTEEPISEKSDNSGITEDKVNPKEEKQIESPAPKEEENEAKEKIEETKKETQKSNTHNYKEEKQTTEIPASEPKEKEEKKKNNTDILLGILNEANTLVARGKLDEAQTTIINGLALKKDHKRLNLLLGTIYEKQKKYDAVEILYKDLAKAHPDDPQVIKSLADTLIIKKKYNVAIALYEKLLSISEENEETLFVLSHLTSQIEDWGNTYRYTRLYQKQWPNNKEILHLESQSQIHLGKRKEAIETLIKLKNLTPYNADEIQSMIQKLVAEEEMAENFNSQNS